MSLKPTPTSQGVVLEDITRRVQALEAVVPPTPTVTSPWYGLDVLTWEGDAASGAPVTTFDATHAQWHGWTAGIPGLGGTGLIGAADFTHFPTPWACGGQTGDGQNVVCLVDSDNPFASVLIGIEIDLTCTGAMASDVYIQGGFAYSSDHGATWTLGDPVAFGNNFLLEVGTSHETPGGANDGDQRSKLWAATMVGVGGSDPTNMGFVWDLFADPTTFSSATGRYYFARIAKGSFSFLT